MGCFPTTQVEVTNKIYFYTTAALVFPCLSSQSQGSESLTFFSAPGSLALGSSRMSLLLALGLEFLARCPATTQLPQGVGVEAQVTLSPHLAPSCAAGRRLPKLAATKSPA